MASKHFQLDLPLKVKVKVKVVILCLNPGLQNTLQQNRKQMSLL